MGTRQGQRADARAQILEAAVGVLRAEGMEKLSQTRVARAAGVSQGHLTYYFPRKTDLWLAVAEHSLDHLRAELAAFFASAGWPGADATTRERVTALVSFLVGDRERTRLLLTLALKGRDDPELHALTVSHARSVRELLARGMGDRSTEEIDLALATLWGIALQHVVFEGERDDDYTEALVRRFFARSPD
jgi:AcrR family transcriptional regulator